MVETQSQNKEKKKIKFRILGEICGDLRKKQKLLIHLINDFETLKARCPCDFTLIC